MKKEFKNIIGLNLSLIVMATAAPLGNYISLPPELSVWIRCILAFTVITFFCIAQKISFKYNYKKDTGSFIFSAVMQCGHWITYFYALQMAGAGLGVISLYTYPIFTTLLEPFIRKTKFNPQHLLLGFLVLIGLYILTPEFNFGNQTTLGIFMAVLSALFFATRNILMKKHVGNYNPSMLMFYQTGFIVLLILPVIFFLEIDTNHLQTQMPFLAFLGIITTAVGHTSYVKMLKHFSATSASLLSCIQPLYVVSLAFIFLDEIPTISTAIGGSIIISSVILETLISKKP